MWRSLLFASLVGLMAGCAHAPPNATAAPSPPKPSPIDTAKAAGGRLEGAAETPLHDVNVVQTKIPAVLREAVQAPYAPPNPKTCVQIAYLIGPLDTALGPDLDKPATPSDPSMIARSEAFAGDAATDAVKGAAEGLIPMRYWVRRLTGAERHDREVAAAITAGAIRRAYLKGLGLDLNCASPAAPTAEALRAAPKAASPGGDAIKRP